MITVHHLENSRSQRVLWTLEELNVPYEIKFYKRDPVTLLAPPELKAIHPLGKSPVISDGSRVIAESGLILDYLVTRYGQGKLRPQNEDDLLRYQYWLHYAEGSFMTPMIVKLVFKRVETGPMPFFVKPVAKKISQTVNENWTDREIKVHLDYLETEIARTGWFAGAQFTAADIMMTYPVQAAAESGMLFGKPNLEDFLRRVTARASYKKAIERGGPFSVNPSGHG
ncbi:MAG: glutathione S-transferase family protein [Bacteriovoracaceae bacterium]